MTKVARIFEEEKLDAVNERDRDVRRQIAKEMLSDGKDIMEIMKYTRFTRTELDEIQASVGA